MKVKKYSWFPGILFVLLIFQTITVVAQECQVVSRTDKGNYVVKIDGKEYLALSQENEKNIVKLRRLFDDERKKSKRLEAIVEDFKEFREKADASLKNKDDIIKELKSIIELYKNMTREYKRIKSPLVTAEVGVGLTGDTEPAVMLGIGFKKLRIYGFFQKENAGAMVGLALPIF